MGAYTAYGRSNGNGVLAGAWGPRRQSRLAAYWLLGAGAAFVILLQYLFSQARTCSAELALCEAEPVLACCMRVRHRARSGVQVLPGPAAYVALLIAFTSSRTRLQCKQVNQAGGAASCPHPHLPSVGRVSPY